MSQDSTIEFPLTWTERLENMKEGESLEVEKYSTVDMAIRRNYKDSEKVFKIRQAKDGKIRVWRLK